MRSVPTTTPTFPGVTVISLMLAAAIAIGCSQQSKGEALKDGCYWLENTPIFEIAGSQGRLLVDGDMSEFSVESEESDLMHQAMFTPGFRFATQRPPAVSRNVERPKTFYMMDPRAKVPTILMHTQDARVLRVEHRPSCT
jgi:hypothetical protein